MQRALGAATTVHSGRIAGAANEMALEFLRTRLEPARVDAILARANAALGHDLTRNLAESWIPWREHAALLDAARAETGSADLFWDLGVWESSEIRRVLPGADLLIKLANPTRLVKAAPLLWKTYVDFGHVEVEDCHAQGGRMVVADYEANANFCMTTAGMFAGLLARAGANACTVEHPSCLALGGEKCVFVGAWA